MIGAATNGWRVIAEEPPPNGERVLLYFAAEGGRNVLGPMMTINVYPPPFPRRPVLWAPIPELPESYRPARSRERRKVLG
jgi:hypothetical protein